MPKKVVTEQTSKRFYYILLTSVVILALTIIYTHTHFSKKFFNVYFWERERQTVQVKRERETQNLKQAPDSELSAHSLTWGSSSRSMRSWSGPRSDTQLTEPPRCPSNTHILHTSNTQYFLMQKQAFIYYTKEAKTDLPQTLTALKFYDYSDIS